MILSAVYINHCDWFPSLSLPWTWCNLRWSITNLWCTGECRSGWELGPGCMLVTLEFSLPLLSINVHEYSMLRWRFFSLGFVWTHFKISIQVFLRFCWNGLFQRSCWLHNVELDQGRIELEILCKKIFIG